MQVWDGWIPGAHVRMRILEPREILDSNFGSYKIPRFSWVPKIETVLIESPDAPPQGGGGPAIIGMGGVIANAIHDATGARLYQLPMTRERVREAMNRG